jgi:hypothetical protein
MRAGQVPGAGVIEEIAALADDAVAATADPTSPIGESLGTTLRTLFSQRLLALAEAGTPSPHGLEIAKTLVLQPGRAVGIVGAVAELDLSWLAQHGEEIVRGTPQVCMAVVRSFRRTKDRGGPLAARLALVPGIDVDALRAWADARLTGDALAALRATLSARPLSPDGV